MINRLYILKNNWNLLYKFGFIDLSPENFVACSKSFVLIID